MQWKQIERWEDKIELPEIRFNEVVTDPTYAIALLLFGGRTLWLRPADDELVRLVYKKPHFVVTKWRKGSPYIEVSMTPDFLTVASLLSKNAAFLQ